MAFEVFPYREEEPRLGMAPIRRPTVDSRLSLGPKSQTIRALVDTGAPFCIMGRAVADSLGIDMRVRHGGDRDVHILGGIHPARMAITHLELPRLTELYGRLTGLFYTASWNNRFSEYSGGRAF
jgi:hypothetical protein